MKNLFSIQHIHEVYSTGDVADRYTLGDSDGDSIEEVSLLYLIELRDFLNEYLKNEKAIRR